MRSQDFGMFVPSRSQAKEMSLTPQQMTQKLKSCLKGNIGMPTKAMLKIEERDDIIQKQENDDDLNKNINQEQKRLFITTQKDCIKKSGP